MTGRLLNVLCTLTTLLASFPIITAPRVASATEIENGLGLRIFVAPPAADVSDDMEGAVISGGSSSLTFVHIRRDGTRISISNQQLEFACRIDLIPTGQQVCFKQTLAVAEVLPLSHFGTASHPFLVVGKVGNWPIAIYAGLDGIPLEDRCKRFISTISETALLLARKVCPDAISAFSPITGAVFQYEAGTPQRHQPYSIQLTKASYDDLSYDISTGGLTVQRTDGPVALSDLMRLLTWCKPIVQRMYAISAGENISCDRVSSPMAWRDKLTFIGVRNSRDLRLAMTLRSYKLEIKGTLGNSHSSLLETEIWMEAGVPLRVRYVVSSGAGPGGIPANVEYTEVLEQIDLPSS
jgi:hypothetical protein